jgi:acetyl-CoA carboxylase biotin carboxyl carrier protein
LARAVISEEAANALPRPDRSRSPAPQLTPAPVQSIPTSAASHPGAQAEEAASEDQDLRLIKSPIVGTFYRSPSPAADSFVRIGSQVEPTTVVCIIEAMKLMNEIQAETTGRSGKDLRRKRPGGGIRTTTLWNQTVSSEP